jgi:hypothetical protein
MYDRVLIDQLLNILIRAQEDTEKKSPVSPLSPSPRDMSQYVYNWDKLSVRNNIDIFY